MDLRLETSIGYVIQIVFECVATLMTTFIFHFGPFKTENEYETLLLISFLFNFCSHKETCGAVTLSVKHANLLCKNDESDRTGKAN